MSELLGRGIPNIILEKDYKGDERRWVLRVETTVPLDNEVEVRKFLENQGGGQPETVLETILKQVPDAGGRADAQHMVAAAFGFEFDTSGKLQARPKP